MLSSFEKSRLAVDDEDEGDEVFRPGQSSYIDLSSRRKLWKAVCKDLHRAMSWPRFSVSSQATPVIIDGSVKYRGIQFGSNHNCRKQIEVWQSSFPSTWRKPRFEAIECFSDLSSKPRKYWSKVRTEDGYRLSRSHRQWWNCEWASPPLCLHDKVQILFSDVEFSDPN